MLQLQRKVAGEPPPVNPRFRSFGIGHTAATGLPLSDFCPV